MKGIVFDWGGVLMKTADFSSRWEWDDKLNLPQGSVEDIFFSSQAWLNHQAGRTSDRVFWREIGAVLGIEPELIPDFRYDFFAGDTLDREIISLIRCLRKKGYGTGLLSNNSPMLRTELEAYRIVEFFDRILISCETGLLKPDKEIFRQFTRMSGITNDFLVLIDDSYENVLSARSEGWNAIHYHAEIDLSHDLEAFFQVDSRC